MSLFFFKNKTKKKLSQCYWCKTNTNVFCANCIMSFCCTFAKKRASRKLLGQWKKQQPASQQELEEEALKTAALTICHVGNIMMQQKREAVKKSQRQSCVLLRMCFSENKQGKHLVVVWRTKKLTVLSHASIVTFKYLVECDAKSVYH